MSRVTTAVLVLSAVTLMITVPAYAAGNSNSGSSSGVGDISQSGSVNINFQGSNDDNTINNTITDNRVTNSGNVTNTNTNTNSNTNTVSNTNNNNSSATATGGNSSATGGNATSTSAGGRGGNSTVTVEGDDAAASSAAPVVLTSSNDTCMGSSGVGAQGMNFGFSVGTTWTDSNCIMLKNARELRAQGHVKAAKARLCMDDDNAMAFQLAGNPCPEALKTAQNALASVREWQGRQAVAAQARATTGSTRQAAALPAGSWTDADPTE